MKSLSRIFLVVFLFAIAMGFLEAIVVVYLRELFYPGGFHFPLVTLPSKLVNIEIVREVTTIIMLVSIGLLTGKTKNERFAWFLFVFGVWDIFYYVGLKMFLNWPVSLMTWDILFLIPVTWIGPVLAPVICSITMILISVPVIFFERNGNSLNFGNYIWTLFISGAIIILFSFVESSFILLYFEGFFNLFNNDFNPANLEKAFSNFVPEKFNWLLFIIGKLFILGGAFHLIRQYLKKYKRILNTSAHK
jgi:hypothetical protein